MSRLATLVFASLLCSFACKSAEPESKAEKESGAKADTKAEAASKSENEGEGEGEGAGEGDSGAEAAGEGEAQDGAAETETETGEEAEPLEPLPEDFEKVGVEVCDKYVEAYSACIADKVPEGEREAQRRIVFENVKAWKQTASGGPSAEKGLQTACQIAREQAKRATESWACTW